MNQFVCLRNHWMGVVQIGPAWQFYWVWLFREWGTREARRKSSISIRLLILTKGSNVLKVQSFLNWIHILNLFSYSKLLSGFFKSKMHVWQQWKSAPIIFYSRHKWEMWQKIKGLNFKWINFSFCFKVTRACQTIRMPCRSNSGSNF